MSNCCQSSTEASEIYVHAEDRTVLCTHVIRYIAADGDATGSMRQLVQLILLTYTVAVRYGAEAHRL